MKKMQWFTLILVWVSILSILSTPFVSARPLDKTYVVNSNASDPDDNVGNNICHTASGKCTLYAAIQEANADGENRTIVFSQKFQEPDDIHSCFLPVISGDYTTIDARSQWGVGRPGVEIE